MGVIFYFLRTTWHRITTDFVQLVGLERRHLTNFGGASSHRITSHSVDAFLTGVQISNAANSSTRATLSPLTVALFVLLRRAPADMRPVVASVFDWSS